MSVRNILDGTIKVGSGGDMPVEPVIPEELTLKKLTVNGPIQCGGLDADTLGVDHAQVVRHLK